MAKRKDKERPGLLKIPDHVVIKTLREEVKRLENRIDNQKQIIINLEAHVNGERHKMKVLKELMENTIGKSSTQSLFGRLGNELRKTETDGNAR